MKSWKDKATQLAHEREKVLKFASDISPIKESKLKLPNPMKRKIRR